MALDLGKLLDNPYSFKLNSLTNFVDLASTAGEMFLVAPEDIKKEVYIFDTRSDEEINLESDITDNWVEDNSTMQDHIGLKPMLITLAGYVGELKNTPRNDVQAITQGSTPLISSFGFLAPKLTTQAQYVLNRANEVYGIYEKANRDVGRLEQVLKDVPVPDEASKQQQAFGRFYELWKTRQLCTVYTPFGVFNSMAILKVTANQGEESAFYSSFTVTFKEVRIASRLIEYKDTKKSAGRTAQTLSKKVDKGVKKPQSTLFNLEQKAFNFMGKK